MFTTGYMKPSLLGAVIPVLIIEVVFRYMVLNRYYLAFDSDTIVYLGNLYNIGQVIIYSGGTPVGTGTVVPYYPVSKMSFQQELNKFPIVKITKIIPGQLNEGTHFFAIRLCSNDGYKTPFMSLTNQIPIFDDIDDANDYTSYLKSVPYFDGRQTSVGVRLEVQNIDTFFDYFEIIDFSSNSFQNIDHIFIAQKVDIVGSTYSVDIVNSYNNEDYSIADLNWGMIGYHTQIRPATIRDLTAQTEVPTPQIYINLINGLPVTVQPNTVHTFFYKTKWVQGLDGSCQGDLDKVQIKVGDKWVCESFVKETPIIQQCQVKSDCAILPECEA